METENPTKRKTATLLLIWVACAVIGAEPVASKKEMPRIRHLDPGQAIASFQVREGFQIKLAAAEPLVADPMAMAFDERGRLYVVEMHGYPEKRLKRIGKVRLLTDTDNDGVFDFSSTFAENLGWPSAIICYDGGVFIGCAPDIYFMKDTDGDGIADEKKTVFTGFRTGSPREIAPRLFNSFRWGYDNRIYAASSMNGGVVRRPDQPESEAINLTRDDFSFDPKTFDLRPESGTAQHGMSFDLRGHRYVSRNSNHLQAYLYDARYARRKSRYSMPHWKQDIAVEGPAAKIFRISPPEPWRVLRTRWRVGGQISGPVEGGGTTFGYFTSATGVTIYKGDAFPSEYVGNAFIGAPANNLVHRKLLTFKGAEPVARRAEQNREFIASTDNWFRPVIFENGPDGCLWMADMYRETIEVAHAIPEAIKEHLDIYSGTDRGRIYRIVPEGFKSRSIPEFADTKELVRLLEHRNSWHRDTAARLLFERADQTAVELLQQVLLNSRSFPAKIHALYLLRACGTTPDLTAAMWDTSPAVREHAIRLAENELSKKSDRVLGKLILDPDARVRLQLAFSLGQMKGDRQTRALAALSKGNNDRWINAAILNSYRGEWPDLFAAVTQPNTVLMTDSHRDLALAVLEEIGALKDPGSRASLSNLTLGNQLPKYEAALAIGAGLRRSRTQFNKTSAKGVFDSLLKDALLDSKDPNSKHRLRAIALLSFATFNDVNETLYSLLSSQHPSAVRLATLKSLDQFTSPEIAAEVLKHWTTFTPALRDEALRILFRRTSHQLALLRAVESGAISVREIPFNRQGYLKRSRNAEIKAAASRLFGSQTLSTRADALHKFTPALQLKGNGAAGARHVQERCHTCHRFRNQGFSLGPDLETVSAWTAEELLTHILDPNRKVEPNQRGFTIETKDDESYSGLVEAETDSNVTLRMPNGIRQEIKRVNIRSLTSQGLSLMPEGLEENLTPQDMADLIAYLKN